MRGTKYISRSLLRGKPLSVICMTANTTKHEFGKNDNRIFCYGLNDSSTEELIDECKKCKANVIYAEPIERV